MHYLMKDTLKGNLSYGACWGPKLDEGELNVCLKLFNIDSIFL
jgi:hypothetical protein